MLMFEWFIAVKRFILFLFCLFTLVKELLIAKGMISLH